jgi:hypothetical protein
LVACAATDKNDAEQRNTEFYVHESPHSYTS